ncbi:peroxisomal membrane protein PEX16 [Stomoxys calcitrans]|uniref:Peroxisomal membrane protein PEX16 n=1 Tax=Stomoxys calcitrans TaxID=35570 RepID=A0A1I8PBL5_STOCA|nr:peroxisomal membrane protein PEX16 [Stomoxys calcitrans]
MDKIKYILKSYESWVEKNPQTIGDFEMTAKWASYFVAGRITDSSIATELVYSLSNLLVLYNDRILSKIRSESNEYSSVAETTGTENFSYRLKVILTTLEYTEVFIEISAKRLFGPKGKWVFITLLQCFKAAGRYFILKHSSVRIVTSPALPPLNRKSLLKKSNATSSTNQFGSDEHSVTFKLKRSGRLMRKVEGAPPLQYRTFKLEEEVLTMQKRQHPKALLQAEYLYIAKPLIHLVSMGLFGEKSWKQYVVSLAVDLASIKMYHKNRQQMSKEQQRILSHRCLNLCMYLMRSPFYENITQSRLETLLNLLGRVPIAKMLAGPLRDYIPHWQSIYFYIWST